MTQIVDIVLYMLRNGSITNKQAMQIGVGRLSARIGDLRCAGVGIDTIPILVQTKHGKTSRIGKYVFHSEASKEKALEYIGYVGVYA